MGGLNGELLVRNVQNINRLAHLLAQHKDQLVCMYALTILESLNILLTELTKENLNGR